jgi:hypothetical protein
VSPTAYERRCRASELDMGRDAVAISSAWCGRFMFLVLDPRVELALGLLARGERAIGLEHAAQALVEPFELAGHGGRARHTCHTSNGPIVRFAVPSLT